MAPEALAQVLRPLSSLFDPADYPDILVGLDDPDDAAIYRLNDDQALVATVDFFTPIVDDPYAYGAIAAANSLSDIYAMGGWPLFALNIASFPENLPVELLSQVMRGGAEKVIEAGALVHGELIAALHPLKDGFAFELDRDFHGGLSSWDQGRHGSARPG